MSKSTLILCARCKRVIDPLVEPFRTNSAGKRVHDVCGEKSPPKDQGGGNLKENNERTIDILPMAKGRGLQQTIDQN